MNLHKSTRLMRGLLAAAGLALTLSSQAATYTELVDTAREQIRSEQFVAGLASAKDAVRTSPFDYKGHYYVALALMSLGNLEDALPAADQAMTLAPPASREDVDKLVQAIKNRRGFANSLQQADAALAEGYTGKAARLYEQAWNAGRDNPDAGFRAADLYATRLSQLVDAGRVLRQIAASSNGGDVQAKATAELQKLTKSLSQIARSQLSNARQQQEAGDIPAAIASLQAAEDADPRDAEVHILRAQIAANGQDYEFMQKAVRGLAKNNAARPEALAALPRMEQWLMRAEFQEFMTDLIGPNLVAETRQRIKKTRDDWADYQKKKIAYRQDLAAEEARSASCHAALPAILQKCLEAAPMGGLFGSNEKKAAHKQQCRETNEQSIIECNVHPPTPPRQPSAIPYGVKAD